MPKTNEILSVDLETYLLGVLSGEVKFSWPPETLKAFAIAARTYALYRLLHPRKSQWDLYGTVLDQVYRPLLYYPPESISLVQSTRGEVLSYHNEIFPTFYHNTCGGHTLPAFVVFKQPWIPHIPPLAGVSCPYCRNSPHYTWDYSLSFKDFLHTLGYQKRRCSGFTFQKTSSGKEPSSDPTFTILCETFEGIRIPLGTYPASALRERTGFNALRSTDFQISQVNEAILFQGHGWGHRVGLCQEGAKTMGERGFSSAQILQFYYPQSQLISVY